MRALTKIFTNKNFLPLLAVILLGVLAVRSLLFEPGYFVMHDDLQMMRQLEMERCFLDWQIPCRWVPDMGYGFGFPLFNFYPPLPYLIGELFRLVGFSFVTTIKLTFAIALIGSGITMYFLAKEFFDRFGGVVSALFYMWAPYHAVEIYVRGAANENWALVFFPLIFLYTYKLIREKNSTGMDGSFSQGYKFLKILQQDKIYNWVILLALSWVGLFMSHNLMVLIFTPVFGLWVLVLLWLYKVKQLPYLIMSGIWAFALAAFFTLPALMENSLTQVKSQLQGYFEYSAHFVTLNQLLISRYWGYGGSAWDTMNDAMSFSIGHIHWLLAIAVGFAALMKFFVIGIKAGSLKNSINKLKIHPIVVITCLMVLVGWFAAFLTHSRSTFIYIAISVLQYVQFPWRFLTIVIFAFSFLIGGVSLLFKSNKSLFNLALKPLKFAICSFVIILVVGLNWSFFKPFNGKLGPLTDAEKFSGVAWELQQAAGSWDYLPATAKTVPLWFRSTVADIQTGRGIITDSYYGTNWLRFRTETPSETTVVLNAYAFPNWQVFIDDDIVDYTIPESEKWGRMYITVPAGNHQIYAKLQNTPIRTVGNVLSLLAWGVLFGVLLLRGRFNNSKSN